MNPVGNNHAAVITGVAYCFGFAIFLYASFSTFVSYDAFWHLKMGQDLLADGLSPGIDHYSFTFHNEPISPVPWLFQVIIALFVSIFGWPEGFQLVKIFAVCLALLGTYLFYREIKAPWQIVLITLPYFLIFMLFRYNHVRPEIFENILVMLALVLYLRASKSFSHKNLAYIALFMLIWVNYHAPILGFVIFFGLFLDKAIEMIRESETRAMWLRWAGWGMAVFLVGFANPDLEHQVFSIFNYAGKWEMVAEFRPTNEIVPNSAFFYVFWLVAAYIAVFLVMRRQYGLALVCCIYAFQSWQSIRIVTVSGIVITALLAMSLSQVKFDEFFASIKPRIKLLVIGLGVFIALSGIVHAVDKAIVVHNMDNSQDLPKDIAAYLESEYPQGGNIFNQLRHGGFLLHRLSPEFRIYIDGRSNILYPVDFVKRYSDLFHAVDNASIADEIRKYDIDFAIYPFNFAAFPLVDDSHAMSAEFVSKNFMLLSRRKNNFPLSSRLMYFPMCWQALEPRELAAELELANKILPADSVLLPILKTLVALTQSADPEEVFRSYDLRQLDSVYHRQLLGYAALDLGADEHAYEFFGSIAENDSLNSLMLAHAALNMGRYRASEEILLIVASEAWTELIGRKLSGLELAIAFTLFDRLKQNQALTAPIDDQLAQLKQILSKNMPGLSLPLTRVVPKERCDDVFTADKVSRK